VIDAYKIGVSIAMTNGISQVLTVIQRDLLGLNKAVDLTTGGFNRMKMAAVGFGAVVAGGAIAGGMIKLVEHGEKLVHQQYEMRRLGLSNAEVASATASAWQVATTVQGTNVSRNMEILREAKGAFGTLPEAQALLPDLAKADVVQGGDDRGLQTIMKAIEIRGDIRYNKDGTLDVAYARAGLDAAMKFLAASGGQIDASTLKGLVTMAGPMAKMMEPAAFYRTMLTATEELQQKAGTSLSAAGRALYGGIMPGRNAIEMERLHLLNPAMVQGKGNNVKVEQGALTGFNILNGPGGLAEWADKVLRPAFHADYLVQRRRYPSMTETQYDQQELYRALPTETLRRLLGLFIQQAESVAKGAANFDHAQGLKGYDTAIATDPTTKMKAFTTAWDNLLTALGAPLVDTAYSMLGKVTHVINDLTKWASDNPDSVKALERFGLAVGAVFVVLGTGLVVAAAITALGVLAGPTGILAVAAGLVALGNALPSLHDLLHPSSWLSLGPGALAPAEPERDEAFRAAAAADKAKRDADWAARQRTFPKDWGDSPATVRPESYRPPPSSDNQPKIQTIIYLDKRELARAVSGEQARAMSLPNAGTSRYDNRVTPTYPSNLVSA
jgi:hypothetical protein